MWERQPAAARNMAIMSVGMQGVDNSQGNALRNRRIAAVSLLIAAFPFIHI